MVHYIIYAQKGTKIGYYIGMNSSNEPMFAFTDECDFNNIDLWDTIYKWKAKEEVIKVENYFNSDSAFNGVKVFYEGEE